MAHIIKLETPSLVLEFNIKNGSLEGLYSKVSDWHLLNRPQLGLSFRMMLPLTEPEHRNNDVYGNEQKSPNCEHSDKFVKFTWDTVKSKFGGTHNIKVTTICEIVDDQAVFRMNIKNNSSEFIENVYYPYFGDVHRPVGCELYKFKHGSYAHLKEYSLFPEFSNTRGYHGVDFPTIMPELSREGPPMYPLALFEDNNQNGFYIGIAENKMEIATWIVELLPGYENSVGSRVPKEDVLGGKDVSIRFGVGHMPYIAPGTEFDLLSFGIEAYKGNWNKGVNCHTKVSKKWSALPDDMPEWTKNPYSWLQLHINSPEDELRIKYKDLPAVGEECAKNGVKVIQLVGWNYGGQDRGNPYHDHDPRLGTYEELKDAIKKIQAMGVKVILFAKFVWADRSNKDFKTYLEPMAIKDPYGDYYMYDGYMYNTLTQLTNVNTRRLIPMCFGYKEYMDLCIREFKKCVDLGAAGILYDESHHHKPTLGCFDSTHGHRYGEHTYTYDKELIDNFKKVIGDREFMFAGESAYDYQFNYYHVTYTRTWQPEHRPISRMLRPKGAQIMTGVNGFNDRVMVNRCLCDMYIIQYEPYNFKGMLSDFPLTVEYGKQMDKLRTDLKEYFWDGTFCGNLGVTVSLDNGKEYSNYSVFVTDSGKYGVIICNDSETDTIKVKPTIENGQKLTSVRLVENDTLSILNEYIEIPPLSAVAII